MPAYVWFPIIAGLSVGFSFMSIPPLADQFMSLFGVGYAGLAVLLSGLLWSHALMQIPAGLLVDRIGVFRAFVIAAGLGITTNLVPLLEPQNLPLAITCRFLLGVCTGLMFLCVLKILGVLAPADRMAKAQGLYGGSFGFGTMLPYFILPHLGPSAWVYSYVVGSVLYAITLSLLSLLPRERFRQQLQADVSQGVTLFQILKTCLASPETWILGLMHGIFYGTLNNMGQWLPSILADRSGLTIGAWTLATTLVLCLGSCSRTLSGFVLRFVPRVMTVNGVLLAASALYLVMSLVGQPHLTLVLGLALAVVVGFSYGTIFTMGSRVLPVVFTGTALGLLNSVANLVNVGLTLFFGNIREWHGSFDLALAAVAVFSLAMWILFRKTVRRIDETVE